tara:strand:- start:324 stop:632 length:309 start_codon:yes stop_codon:yes gene_type:complete
MMSLIAALSCARSFTSLAVLAKSSAPLTAVTAAPISILSPYWLKQLAGTASTFQLKISTYLASEPLLLPLPSASDLDEVACEYPAGIWVVVEADDGLALELI